MTASAEGMADLRSCPFCQSSVVGPMDDGHVHWVECRECDAEGPTKYFAPAAIAAWNRRANPWVSVAERLPEEDKEVLAWSDAQDYSVFAFHNAGTWFDSTTHYRIGAPTHWQEPPLPPMTKEER
jgi:Lar family restriction alleviation protein